MQSIPFMIHEVGIFSAYFLIRIDDTGTLLVTTSTDGRVFFMEARISKKLRVVGFIGKESYFSFVEKLKKRCKVKRDFIKGKPKTIIYYAICH